MKVVILINDTTYAYKLRKELISELIHIGYEVKTVGEELLYQSELNQLGCKWIPIRIRRRGTNPFCDLQLMLKYASILKKEKPDVVLTFNIKPNIYGSIACRILKIPYISNITGLGKAVENPGILQKITIFLYKIALKEASTVFFQNEANQEFFIEKRIIPDKIQRALLPGSGVNLKEYQILDYPSNETVRFLYVARIMKEKGIDLYLNLAKRIKKEKANVIFEICGMCDDPKYQRILLEEQEKGNIIYHGMQENLIPFLEKASCLIHPSYYPEGMSNVLLEAAASGRPVIASRRSGCMEMVEDGVTGFCFEERNERQLLMVVERFLKMSITEREKMGVLGRKLVEKNFDRDVVVNEYIKTIRKVEHSIR